MYRDEIVARLRLAQMLSPAFPIGAFAHSQGLEWAISSGQVGNSDDLRDWIEAVLTLGSARVDAVFLSMARRPGADLDALSDLFDAYLPSAERALEAAELGRAFQALTRPEMAPLPYPLAVAEATRDLPLPEAEVLALFLQGVAAQLVSVAVRFLPLGQTQGQRVLARLAPLISEVARAAVGAGEDELWAFAPGADLAAMAHETMETRIFRT
ncbi:urease accessory protein UreF [Rhodobacter sp. Har01]|uniref:urease accessory protein UreF n=1 Tax=Rhodobacter sp. Har01 TaxID=2883999 RepID=UPI001D06CC9B|nr:urease accessory UreF family protein [Rhodobacter sp. Har01]MCB6177839.1 urease accessory protein UreF [Rhodobacter sp. Har01]